MALTNWEDPFVVQWMDQNRAKYGEDGWGLMMAAKAAYEDRERAEVAAAGGQVVPQEVRDYFQNYQPGTGSHLYTDGQGYQWGALGEDGGYWGDSQSDQAGGYDQFLRGDELGRKHNEVGSLSSYFDSSSGAFTSQQKSERSATWGELIAQLAASVAGIGVVGAAAGVPLGTAGAAGGTAATGAATAGVDTATMGASGGGLGGSTGTGLTMGGGGTGLTASTGSGLSLAGNAIAPGYMTAAAPGAGAIGAGLGTTGFAAGTGSLLGSAALGGGGGGAGAATSTMGAGGAGGAGGGGTMGSIQNILGGTGTASDWLGLATTALGAYGGSQGQEASTTSTRAMDPRMDQLFYGQLAPTTQGLLASTTPQAQIAGSQLMAKGSGLLGQTEPTTASNPYLKSIADDMQRRTSEMLGQNNLAIQGNAVASGGLGGSRQGVAQGTAASKAADYLQGNVAGLYGNAYNADQNRLRQDWTLGSGMLGQGVNMPFAPAQSTAQIYSPFTGYGTTTNSQQTGGGWQGALGGALGAAQYGKNAGWW